MNQKRITIIGVAAALSLLISIALAQQNKGPGFLDPAVQGTWYDRSVSLVEGISQYGNGWSSLTEPRNDAVAAEEPHKAAQAGMVYIQGGTFMMGCSSGDSECRSNEKPAHQVTVNSFWMDAHEVTQSQYQSVMGENPSDYKGCADCPVENVTWFNARDYCSKVGKRLPTEAEWEYAARARTTESRYGNLDAIAWYRANSGGGVHPVGLKQPNAFGLYDMLGNVWEWTADWFGKKYYLSSPSTNPQGPSSGSFRVLRGGSWSRDPREVRASNRYWLGPKDWGYSNGCRCSRD